MHFPNFNGDRNGTTIAFEGLHMSNYSWSRSSSRALLSMCFTLIVALAVPNIASAQPLIVSPGPAASSTASDQTYVVNPTAAVLIGVAATIAPMYLAKATYDEKEGVSAVGRGAMLAGLALGPSFGYLYARRPGYALVSAIGKGALLALGVGLDARLEKQEMEQAEDAEVDGLSLGMVAALGVVVWDVVDLCLLPGHVREDNIRQSSMSIVPVVGTAQGPELGMSVAATF